MATRSSDHDQIINIINLYSIAIDAEKWDLFDHIFTSDVEAIYPPPQQWTSLAEWKRDFAAQHRLFEVTQHFMTIKHIAVDQDKAHAITYGQWLLKRQLDLGKDDQWRGQGWYDDELVRTEQGWRIKKRVCYIMACEGDIKKVLGNNDLPDIELSSIKTAYTLLDWKKSPVRRTLKYSAARNLP